MPSTIAVVDGIVFTGRFAGFNQPLKIDPPAGSDAMIRVPPWRYRDHMRALRDCVFVSNDGLDLEHTCYVGHVLRRAAVPEALHEPLAPLALWWAAGGDPSPARAASDGWLDLGGWHARLQPWSERARLASLLAARREDDVGAAWLDAIGYLDAMVRATVAEVAPADGLDVLDSQATSRLLTAVVALNVPDLAADPVLGDGPIARNLAETTLSLCRALGWTPSAIWDAPAAEVDRLLRLLARVQTPPQVPPVPRRTSSLAGDPRATRFYFVDDGV